jgi:hypothetical protein
VGLWRAIGNHTEQPEWKHDGSEDELGWLIHGVKSKAGNVDDTRGIFEVLVFEKRLLQTMWQSTAARAISGPLDGLLIGRI